VSGATRARRLSPIHAALAALVLAACASAPPPAPPQPQAPAQQAIWPAAAAIAPIDLDNAPDGTKVTVKRGGELKLILDLQGMYMFAWQLETNIEPVLSQIGERVYVGKGANGYDVLAGGSSIYRFRAEQPGKVSLTLVSRSRADNATLRSVRYDVTVE
jgi:predicted secreted protein